MQIVKFVSYYTLNENEAKTCMARETGNPSSLSFVHFNNALEIRRFSKSSKKKKKLVINSKLIE